ncbi:MAG: hypothetical protein V1758_16575 [Pseudomonadota bacterium]
MEDDEAGVTGQKRANLYLDQRGFLLVGLIITMLIISVLGAALLTFTTTSTFSGLFANRQSRAYYLSESGARYAIPRIQADRVQAVSDLHGKTFTLTNGDRFTLSIDISASDSTLLASEGIVHQGDWLEARVKNTYRIPVGYRFEYGAFAGTGRIRLDRNAYIDSYDASVGPWSLATRRQNGNIGTNRTGNRSIDIKNTARVYGNAVVGPGGNPATDIDVAGGAQITGTRGALAAARDMTPMTMPAGGGTPFDLRLDHFDQYAFLGGTYRLNRLDVMDDAVLTISGHVTLYVEDRIRLEDRGTINIEPGGSLVIYAAEELVALDDARLNATGNPDQLIVFGTASFDRFHLEDNSIMRGAVYAPGSDDTVIKQNAEFFGSVIADEVNIQDNAAFHYDESLGRAGGVGGALIQYF